MTDLLILTFLILSQQNVPQKSVCTVTVWVYCYSNTHELSLGSLDVNISDVKCQFSIG